MESYKVSLIENTEEKNYEWLYWIIDLSIFFILGLSTDNWIVAFLVSTTIGLILKSINPLFKNNTNNTQMFPYSLEFKKDYFSFKGEEIEKDDFIVLFDSIIAIGNEDEKDNSKILIKRKKDLDIVFTSYYSQETSKELFEKIENILDSMENE